jgi:hypothetical protein
MMMNQLKKSLAILAVGLLVSQGSSAQEPALPGSGGFSKAERQLLANAFTYGPEEAVVNLDAAAMDETRGELWPWIIGVAALDVSIASFFWGTYVPTISAAGSCPNCTLATPFPR